MNDAGINLHPAPIGPEKPGYYAAFRPEIRNHQGPKTTWEGLF
jgi:hypothetical protein